MIKETADGILATLKIIPSSSKNEIICGEDFIRVKITAPPVDNKANKALTEYLAKTFKLQKTSITIVSGHSSRLKSVMFNTKDENTRMLILSYLKMHTEKSKKND